MVIKILYKKLNHGSPEPVCIIGYFSKKNYNLYLLPTQISKLYNKCLESGYVPPDWKSTAHVISEYKN